MRGSLGRPLLAATVLSLVASGYLVAIRLLGEAPVCGPVTGCETVTTSEYATVLGIPIAVPGLLLSITLVACAATWWRRADRRTLLLAYGLLLPATLGVAYLSYVELFVIHAICAWCVTFAISVVLALGISGLALRRA